MAFNILAGVEYAQQQGEMGRQRGEGQFINKLLGEAYNAPDAAARKSALARLAGGGQAPAAMAAGQQFQKQDAQMTEDAFKRLQTHAKMIRSVPAEGRAAAWAQIQPRIAQELPEYAQYLPSQWDEAAVMPVVEQLATMGDGGGGSEMFSQKVGADGFIYNTDRNGKIVNTGVKADRQMWFANNPGVDPYLTDKSGNVTQVGPSQQPQQPIVQPSRTYTAQFTQDGAADPFAQLPEQEQQLAMRMTEAGQSFTIQNGRVVPGGAAPQPGFGANGAPPPQAAPTNLPAASRPLPPLSQWGAGDERGQPAANPLRRPSTPTSADKPPSGYRARPDGTLEFIPGGPADPANKPKAQDKPLPVGALRLQIDAKESLSVAEGVDSLIGGLLGDIDSGTLDLGPVKNLAYEARNFAGESTPQSRAYGTFKAGLEKLRNDSLRLNKGVQTDGDAQRAWNELMANINDTAFVRKRLEEIRQINQRGERLQREKLNTIDRNYQGKESAPAEDDISDLLEQYGDSL